MKKLFLDDFRQPWNNTWDLVKNSQEFKEYIEKLFSKTKKVPDIISFDHDLHHEHYNHVNNAVEYNKLYKNFKHETGLDCAKWLCNFCVEEGLKLPKINIHSANPWGSNNIAHFLMGCNLFHFEDEDIIQPLPFEVEPVIIIHE